MGSYLEIDNREINSKGRSFILIDAIRHIDSTLKKNGKGKKYFQAEYYKDGCGCGDYFIKRKGMAILTHYLKNLADDNEVLRDMAIKNHEYYLTNMVEPEKKEEEIKRLTENERNDILWCFDYCFEILTDMILNNQKKVIAHWV